MAAPRLKATADAGAIVVMDWNRTPGRPMALERSVAFVAVEASVAMGTSPSFTVGTIIDEAYDMGRTYALVLYYDCQVRLPGNRRRQGRSEGSDKEAEDRKSTRLNSSHVEI